MKLISSVMVAAGLLTGCSGMLPQAKLDINNPWQDFDAAKASFDQIVPFQTAMPQVRKLGFDPAKTPNVQTLNQAQVISAALPSPLQGRANLPEGIMACMKAGDGCVGYLLEPSRITQQRVGNFFLDFLNFQRDTLTTGWKFSALLVVINDTVVYKQWNGQAHIESTDQHSNPLGPLQSMGETVKVLP